MITTTALVLLTITAKVQSVPSYRYYSQSEIKRQTCALLCSEYRSWLNGEKGITKKSNTQSVFDADWDSCTKKNMLKKSNHIYGL